MKHAARPSVKFKFYKSMRKQLSAHYPHVFPNRGKRPPLKLGILRDIIEDKKVSCSSSQLRFFLSIWTSSTAYLKSVAIENQRYGIDPADFEPLQTAHSQLAKRILSERKKNKSKCVDTSL